MKKTFRFTTLILLLSLFALVLSACTTQQNEYQFSENRDQGSLVLYVFWGDGCSHCEEARPMLAKLDQEFPDLNIRSFEVWHSDANAALFTKMADAHQLPKAGRGTPTFFFGDRSWVGFSESVEADLSAAIKEVSGKGLVVDGGMGIMPGAISPTATPTQAAAANGLIAPNPLGAPGAAPDEEACNIDSEKSDCATPVASNSPAGSQEETLDVPLFGKVDLTNQSIWISTALIAFVDGVNPCSVWVLTMLLALTLHSGSRKKVLVVGLVFLTVTAGVYALFIAGLFTIFSVVSFIGWIQVIVALLALFFAVVNIKDYFWYKEGLSFTISDDKKPGIFQRMRKVMDASQSFPGLIGATIVMAAGVSLVEFSCTAGFPVLWTNLLITQKIEAGLFIALLVLYMLIYQLDEMVIFFTAVFTLKSSRLEESQGRILKLIGGMLMLTLSFVMLFNPAWLNSLAKSLIIFAVAFGLVGLVLLLHRRILPAFGIYIGTEAGTWNKNGRKKRKK
ncbi:MAG: thioredoxin family protein [Anaerolineae bacterium]|nr:thioredoxin family protein [Anaerolineae bacterium]